MEISKQVTRSGERMQSQFDWLESRHSFSFGGHYDPERMGFGVLRVVNEDVVAPGKGFGAHPHSDMEIVSIVLDGQLEHKDSLGNGRVIEAGDIQYMSAGSGVVHSEFNPSGDQPAHFLQIWIEPSEKGLAPRYADQRLGARTEDIWQLLLSPDGRDGSMAIRQSVELRSAQISAGAAIDYRLLGKGRGLWLFVLEGSIHVAGERLERSDTIALKGIDQIQLKNVGPEAASVLLFDVSV